MQELGRYRVQAIDPGTYSILSINQAGCEDAFLLMVNEVNGPYFNVQITLAEIADAHGSSPNFVEFSHETWVLRFFAYSWEQVRGFLKEILIQLDSGIDAGNPVELAAGYGGELCGVEVDWPSIDISELH